MRNKIIYWIATLWMSLGMVATALVQLFSHQPKLYHMESLGYPGYVPKILGVWKILGVIVALIPNFSLLKEWAYAGFFFIMIGALCSHLAVGDPFSEMFPALLLLVLVVVSYYFRPVNRRLAIVNQ